MWIDRGCCFRGVTGCRVLTWAPLSAVFGKVTAGMDVVKKIEATQTDANDNPVTPVKMVSVTIK